MTSEHTLSDTRYPIGEFVAAASSTVAEREVWIADIAALPDQLRAAVVGVLPAMLDTPYRPGGWTVRQVVHHVADSHINSYVRFRLALTEDAPAIKGYDEAKWAELSDAKAAPVDWSLAIIESVHRRWVALLESMSEADFAREMVHSGCGRISMASALAHYSWHGKHHLAHIRSVVG